MSNALRNRSDISQAWDFTSASRDFIGNAAGWSAPAGASFYMVRVLFSGTVTSVVMGTAGASIGAFVWGTAALPFLVTACGGFMFGAIGFYVRSVQESLVMLERYPRLLQLHLDANFPDRGFLGWRRERLSRAVFRRSWVLQSMLVCACLTAQPALDQITETREQALVEEVREELASSRSDNVNDET